MHQTICASFPKRRELNAHKWFASVYCILTGIQNQMLKIILCDNNVIIIFLHKNVPTLGIYPDNSSDKR